MPIREGTSPPIAAGARPRASTGKSVWFLTGAFLVVGLGLRWTMLNATSLWFDEGFTWWVALQSPGRIIEIIRADTWPPLYYLLMHYWISLFGESASAMRAESALASSAALVFSVLLSRRVFSDPVQRVCAAGLLALSATQISYAFDLRCYATATAVLLLAVFAIISRLEGGSRLWLLLYVLSGAVLVYLHNVMWFYLPCVQGAWLLWPGAQSTRRRVVDMLLTNVAVAVLFAPWLPSLIGQMRSVNSSFWIDRPGSYELTKVIAFVGGLPSDLLRAGAAAVGIADHADRIVRWPVSFLVLSAIAACVVAVPGEARRRLLAILAVALGPVLLAFLYSRFGRSIFIERIFVPASAFLPIALASLARPAITPWTAKGIFVSVAILTVISARLLPLYRHEEPWRQSLAHLQAIARPGDRVLFFAAEGEVLYHYYARQMKWPPLATGGIPHDLLLGDPPRVQVIARTEEDLQPLRDAMGDPATSRILLVESHAAGLDPLGLVHDLLLRKWHARKSYEARPIAIWVCER